MKQGKVDISGKILAGYKTRIEGSSTEVLSLVGYDDLDKNSSKLVISCIRPFRAEDVRDFIFDKLQGKVFPIKETTRFYEGPDHRFYATAIVARLPKLIAKVEDKPKFVKVSADTWLDDTYESLWNKEEIGGKQYFSRDNDESLNDILLAASLQASFEIRRTAPIKELLATEISVGDEVTAFAMIDGKPSFVKGIVKEISDKGVVIETKTEENVEAAQSPSGNVIVPENAVVDVSPDKKSLDDVIDYLRKAFNPANSDFDYASLFLKK